MASQKNKENGHTDSENFFLHSSKKA